MFPENSGVYIAQRDENLIVVKVKGVYPTLQLDKKALDLGEFLKSGKQQEVSKDLLDNIKLYHMKWNFKPLNFNFDVFSKIEFSPDGTKLYMSEEDIINVRSQYYRLCQQGVPPMEVVRAISYEFKASKEQIISLVNGFDLQASSVV